jgi:hypothetical protein
LPLCDEDGGRFNHVLSADARMPVNGKTVLTAQLAGTFAEMPFRDPQSGGTLERYGAGLGYSAKIERRSRHLLTAVTSLGSSPDYRADLGFTRRVNTNAISVQTTYNRAETSPGGRSRLRPC